MVHSLPINFWIPSGEKLFWNTFSILIIKKSLKSTDTVLKKERKTNKQVYS